MIVLPKTWKSVSSLVFLLVSYSGLTISFQYGSRISRTIPCRNTHYDVPYRISSQCMSRSKCDTKKDIELRATTVAGVNTNSNDSVKKDSFAKIMWRFTRPHTIIGSALAIPALHILAAPTFRDAFTMKCAMSAMYAMIPSLLMNLYITGLNQITDVEIDKVNKPDLPIAAGDLSMKTAIIAVVASLIGSLVLGVANPILGTQGLNITLWGSMILGTLYSLQPFRLKRFPLLAAFCIVAVRGTVINAGFYAHAKVAAFSTSGVSATFLGCLSEPRCFLSSSFFAVFGVVIGEYFVMNLQSLLSFKNFELTNKLMTSNA